MYYGRGKNKIQNPYTIPDIYPDYKNNVESDSMYDIPYNTYRAVIEMYFKEVLNILFEKSLSFKFPASLGTFQIVKKKRNPKSKLTGSRYINWFDTIKYGKRIFYTNEHSEGFRYFFMWIKDGKTKNISKYKFVPTRTNKRKLAYYIKNRIRDYFEVN